MALEMTSLTMATMNLFSQVLWYAVVAVGLSLVPPQLNSKLSFRSLSDKNGGKVESNHQLLHMATYSTEQGVLSQLVEDRDACGVGFIANLNQKKEHNILKQALNALSCMEHRGATSADNISGDGAGVLTEVPWGLFDSVDPFTVTNKDGSIASAVGMLFLPEENLKEAMDTVNKAASDAGLQVKQWRDVPVDMDVLGELSREFAPTIKQVVFQAKSGYETKDEFEGILYDTRRAIQGVFRTFNSPNAYVCSMSSQTIVYKGMLRSDDVGKFYKDLTNPAYETTFAVYHRRFSTNTVPKWFLAQPMRLLAHNGEINTLLGNINWVKSRQTAGDSKIIRAPLVDTARSDSANLDSLLDAHVRSGRSCAEAVMMLVPEAYSSQPNMVNTPEVESMYKYFESMQEAWDGPALLVFADGDNVGAALDRNGLRPARFMKTVNAAGDEYVHVMSEVGVTKAVAQFASKEYGSPEEGLSIIESGRLGPGEMLSVNLGSGEFKLNTELKSSIASRFPYEDWTKKYVVDLPKQNNMLEVQEFAHKYIENQSMKENALQLSPSDTAPVADEENLNNPDFVEMTTQFGWGIEDVDMQIQAMASTGIEATFCMGDDAPLAALSSLPHTMYDYFKQRFAQVTNPPIDPLREGAVMSLNMYLGPRGDTLSLDAQEEIRVKIDSPVLNQAEYEIIKETGGVEVATISTLYPLVKGVTLGGLEEMIDEVTAKAIEAVKNGATIINLSDKADSETLKGSTYIPPLMATAAVHHKLIELGLRTRASIIVTTGQAWNTHHISCLVGYGASAIIPYAAYDTVINWHGQKRIQNAMESGKMTQLSANEALANYRKALDKGVLKILSKMGISLLSSYQGAQIFESLGINDDVLAKAFKGTASRVSGMTFDDIAAEVADFSRRAYGDAIFEGIVQKVEEGDVRRKRLFNYGFMNFFKTAEYHHNNQPMIKGLLKSIREKNSDLYKVYEQDVRSRPPTTLRDTMEFEKARKPIPLNQVESAESIMKRFCSGGMSLGALSREAHETLGIAMNRIGGKSNSGEGGEDFERFVPLDDVNEDGMSAKFPHLKGLKNGDAPGSKIKQIASGRFGVTPQYLMSAEQLEIKIAQGAKPGEGGQLPGAKIDSYIAGLRKSKVGVTLISPPPHHDIYSIEDLAQLIYDLHQINPKAGVSVKLVSEVGIGTVASGVAKAGADVIQISGHDGGTGASPATSIKHCGSPWELGLAESHSSLLNNGLRQRVILRVDGGLKSGWDVVMAAAMGAEEYGFGTIAMIAEGCIMARVCHTNKCPVGITTQNEQLRKRFPGTPDNIVTFFGYVAEEVRHILAELGYSSLEEIIGQPGLLKQREDLDLKKCKAVDTSFVTDALLCTPERGENFCDLDILEDRTWLQKGDPFDNGYTFDDIILEDAVVQKAIEKHASAQLSKQITNVDRAAFGRVSGIIAAKYGDGNFKGNLNFDLTGAAGQSFCAFLSHGMNIKLSGYANDYVCKAMNGGTVVVAPPTSDVSEKSSTYSMVGNTCLYGATGGKLFVKGRAGERFAVRNSGAQGIVEGLGDHGCEYMTAGTVVSLGSTGRNFGAGMTGGLAFVIEDEEWLDGESEVAGFKRDRLPFENFVNTEIVSLVTLTNNYAAAKEYMRSALKEHVKETDSQRAKRVLKNIDALFDSEDSSNKLPKITMVVPASEKHNPIAVKTAVSVEQETWNNAQV